MQIQQQQVGGILVVTPQEDRLDASVAGTFKGFMVDLINQGGQKVVLNLERVAFIDSSGLTAIVSTLKSLGLAGGEMVVCGINNNVAALFKLTKLDKVFRVFDDINHACQTLDTL
jgi:anti-sigma B factor antagonist